MKIRRARTSFTCRSVGLSRLTAIMSGAAMAVVANSGSVRADENGESFWLPGQFGSLAAVPQTPGWSMGEVYYHASVDASGAAAAAREITIGRFSPTVNVNVNLNLGAHADLVLLAPTYTFASPILGGQLAVGMTGIFGHTSANLNGTLTASLGLLTTTSMGNISDSLTGVGDLYPMISMKWNDGVHNFMTYATGDIPVGSYNSGNLANIGIGHGAIDGGGGYTYFNPQTGHEFSTVAGLTYNFKNPDTQYQSGVDFHLDWGASQFLSEHFHVGLVGYYYNQLTDDSGALPILDGFRSRVAGVGPQIGYLFPVGGMQGYLNLKGYAEFDAANRPSGWNTWLTFSISPAGPASVAPTQHLITK